jgi:hypothetical protein
VKRHGVGLLLGGITTVTRGLTSETVAGPLSTRQYNSEVGVTILVTSNMKLRKVPEKRSRTYAPLLIVDAAVALMCHTKGE